MKVLIVEDRIETVKGIIEYCKEKRWDPKAVSFDTFEKSLENFDPDVIVLDWKEDATGEEVGGQIFEKIWSKGFKPIIIFSAIAGTITLDEKYKSSNLIYIQSKGDEEPVIEYLDSIWPFVGVISGLKNEFNDALIQALNSIDMMSKAHQAQPIGQNVMRYVFARRVSTYFDKECGDDAPPPWIQYTYPAITPTLCVCDVIRSIPADGSIVKACGDAEEYMLILTPSCDIEQGKVSQVLCAKCYSKTEFHKFDLSDQPTGNQLNRIKVYLNTGYNNSLVSLPDIPETLPYMTVNLKDIVFFPIEQIALNEDQVEGQHKYCRIASIDSPFREQIVWAHMINSCRPGMPKRDMELWARELMKP